VPASPDRDPCLDSAVDVRKLTRIGEVRSGTARQPRLESADSRNRLEDEEGGQDS